MSDKHMVDRLINRADKVSDGDSSRTRRLIGGILSKRQMAGVMAVIVTLSMMLTGFSASAVTPPPKHLVLGWYGGDSTQGHYVKSAIDALPAKPRVVSYYMPWEGVMAKTAFNRSFVHAAHVDGVVTEIELDPWDGTQNPPAPYLLKNIANGSSDAQLRALGAQIAAQNEPVWLSFAHEMNDGAWFPWNLHGSEGASPATWVAAWNRVTNQVDKGAGNRRPLIQWVWAANEVPQSRVATLKPYFTGTQNVNILAMDAYMCIGQTTGSCTQTYSSWLAPTTKAIRALNTKLPLVIAETGIGGTPGTRGPQITAFIRAMRADPANVGGFIWYNNHKFVMTPSEEQALADVLNNG